MNDKKPMVLITGAGTGIGAATARLFSENGHPVCLVGRRKEKLQDVARSLKSPSFVISGDLSLLSEARRIMDEASSHGEIGILINNAGIFETESFGAVTDEIWGRLFDVNLFGPI